jgi:hypothetical protein
MSVKRSVFGLLGLLLAVVLAAFAAAPANAATVQAHNSNNGNLILTFPPAPAGARSAAVHPNVVAPTTSPAVTTIHGGPGSTYTCNSGDLCAVVWDPTTSSYEAFVFYVCQRYYLANWFGNGNYYDNQSSSAHSYFYGAGGNVLTSFYPQRTNIAYDWDPVYSIRNC